MTHDLAAQSIHVVDLRAGVDWLTLTARESSQRTALYHRFQKLRGQLRVIDSRTRKFNWRGYTGLQIPGIRWGTRIDSDILILSGASAAVYWKLFSRLCNHVTRLDLAVTCLVYPPIPRLTSTYYTHLERGVRKWSEIRSEEGSTLYIGRRAGSNQMGRIYDKGLEAGISCVAGAIWRYEVEYKQEMPQKILNRLLVETCPRQGITPLVTSHVWHWFNERNIPPVFKRAGDALIEAHVKVVHKDEERTLAWFRTQVSPAVAKLIGHRRTDVLEALGLVEADTTAYCPSI